MDFTIKPLTPELLDDFLAFFDRDAFEDNHEWASCYCRYYHFHGTEGDWERATGEENRAAVIDLINEGKMKGYLAYDGDRVVGWCNANDSGRFPRLDALDDSPGRKGLRICAVACFVIFYPYRRQGLSRLLLRRVCEDYKAMGYDCVEAYPRAHAHTCAENYHGYLDLYIDEGFRIVKEIGIVRVMRKEQ